MAKKFRGGNSYKTQYKAYLVKGQWRKNKLRKLTKRALDNENDTHALTVFEKGSKEYGRNKPGKKGWFHPQEAKLLRDIANEVDGAKEKLANLRSIYADTRPSALRMNMIQPEPSVTPAEQLLNIGLINAKRYKTFRSRMGGLRRR